MNAPGQYRPPDNQDEVCEFVREIMTARTGETVELTARPDVENRTSKAVEELWKSPNHSYAVEHTRVETFEGQIKDDAIFSTLMSPLEAKFAGKVPGTFVLRIASGAASAARVDSRTAQAEIEGMVIAQAAKLQVDKAVTLQSNSLPFTLDLYRRHDQNSKVILYRGFDAATLEERRLDRVRRALEAKCPKLVASATDGRRSILILESDDIALANVFVVSDAVRKSLSEQTQQPERVFVVETDASPWSAWLVKEGDSFGNAVQRPWHYERGYVESAS